MAGGEPTDSPDRFSHLTIQRFEVKQDQSINRGGELLGGETDAGDKDASAVLCFFEMVSFG